MQRSSAGGRDEAPGIASEEQDRGKGQMLPVEEVQMRQDLGNGRLLGKPEPALAPGAPNEAHDLLGIDVVQGRAAA
jgi:hypothetical protein